MREIEREREREREREEPQFAEHEILKKYLSLIKYLTSGFKRLNTDIYTPKDRQKEKTEQKKRLEKYKKKEV